MKLKNVYYLEQPKDIECDSIHLGILTEPGKNEKGGYEYAIEITTLNYIQKWLEENENKFYYNSAKEPIFIVKRLDDETIDSIIDEILPKIDEIALRIE